MNKLILPLIFLCNIVACTTPATTPSISPSASNSPSAPVSQPPAQVVDPSPSPVAPSFTFDSKKEYNVTMETSLGTMKLKLYTEKAPKAVENFTTLISRKYYDNLTFHRVINTFMIQGGDPNGNGTGGESIYGKAFEDEFAPELTFNRKGILAMANSGKNTNQTQFFITLGPTGWLNNVHTIFGEVTSGIDVLDKIGRTPVGERDKPLTPVVMTKLSIE